MVVEITAIPLDCSEELPLIGMGRFSELKRAIIQEQPQILEA
jgi:hypothetical protein